MEIIVFFLFCSRILIDQTKPAPLALSPHTPLNKFWLPNCIIKMHKKLITHIWMCVDFQPAFGSMKISHPIQLQFFSGEYKMTQFTYRGFHEKGIFGVRVYYYARREEHKKQKEKWFGLSFVEVRKCTLWRQIEEKSRRSSLPTQYQIRLLDRKIPFS